jgi:hypothetical protein
MELLERRLVPEAVEHPIGEQLEIGPLDDPAEHLAARQCLHCRSSDGCPGMLANDSYPGTYSYVAIDTSPDAG